MTADTDIDAVTVMGTGRLSSTAKGRWLSPSVTAMSCSSNPRQAPGQLPCSRWRRHRLGLLREGARFAIGSDRRGHASIAIIMRTCREAIRDFEGTARRINAGPVFVSVDRKSVV